MHAVAEGLEPVTAAMGSLGGGGVSGEGFSVQDYVPPWAMSLGTNLGLYFFLFAVGYVIVQQVRRTPVAASDPSFYARMARFWVFGYEAQYEAVPSAEEGTKPDDASQEMSLALRALQLLFCAGGLLGSYLLWGVLQEKIMTTDYSEGKFSSSIFLVFCNRALALTTAYLVVTFTEQPMMRAPFYKFSFTSLSNVLSSWSQLEALKYISFPTQVLAKSSKLIPVMLMGKLISGKSYPTYDYIVAVVIGFGVSVFTLNNSETSDEGQTTTFSGIILIICYLTFDSFTSQWQGHLFREYKMSSYQMMFGVNAFSCFFTTCSLIQSGELITSLSFITKDPAIGFDILIFSTAGATGQMFIFYTIKTFGPLVFTMIMTTRQLVSIILSCVIYGHAISGESLIGAVVVFLAVGYRIYRQNEERKKKESGTTRSFEMNSKPKTSDLK